MEAYYSIIHLALAVAALVPIFLSGGREKWKVVSLGAATLLFLLFLHGQTHRKSVAAVESEIVLCLNDSPPKTFDDIWGACYYSDAKIVGEALEDLVKSHKVVQSNRQISDQGRSYCIRVFSLPTANIGAGITKIAQKGK